MGLKSARYGEISFSFDQLEEMNDVPESAAFDYKELDSFNDFFEEDFLQTEVPESGLIYVSGYVSFKMGKKLTCVECIAIFISDGIIDDQYFNDINRGGLRVPSNVSLELGTISNLVMQQLISKKYESSFVKSTNQKKLLLHLLEESLFLLDNADDKCSICKTPNRITFVQAFKIFSNILLNNYTKCQNNSMLSLSCSAKLYSSKKCGRKLKTLQN